MTAAADRPGQADHWQPTRDHLSAVLEFIDEIVIGLDETGTVRYVSPAVRRVGFEPADMVGHNMLDFLHPDEHEHALGRFDRWVGRAGMGFGPTVRVRDGWGEWIDVGMQSVTGPDAAPYAFLVVVRPAAPAVGAAIPASGYEDRLIRLASAFVHLPAHRIDDGIRAALAEMGSLDGVDRVCVVVIDEEHDLLVNTHEWTAPDIESLRERDEHVPVVDAPLLAAMRRFENVYVPDVGLLGPEWRLEQRFWRSRGTRSVVGVPLVDEGRLMGFVGFEAVRARQIWDDHHQSMLQAGAGIIAQALARQAAEAELAHQARHDSLTGLGNRWYFLDHLERAVASLEPADPADPESDLSLPLPARVGVAVALFDLDRFKVVNDSLGHAAGDQLLTQVAARLDGARRPSDIIARLGGDELVLLCRDVQGPEDAAARAADLQLALIPAVEVDGHEAFMTTSVGVAFTAAAGEPAEDLLRDADAAMYAAKARGRNRVEVFDDQMRARVRRRLGQESELRRAILDGELTVHYQPEYTLTGREILGAEALVRWNHPTRGLLTAVEFVHLAEETGLILDLGPWVLAEACRQLGAWQRQFPDRPFLMRVNLSTRQVGQPDLVPIVVAAIEHAGVHPQSLCLEITETTLMADAEASLEVLEKLRGLGVELAIDDFGTGYSSLAYLKRLPVDVVKIDRSFVDGLGTDPDDTAIVSAIVSLGGALGLQVTAEGIETAEQCHELVRLGVDRGQGYLLARPMPATELTVLLSADATTSAR